jgi:histidinol-phosphate/aromatic aminotransferase/cobyric acid decarboxylase-like protein
MTMIADHEIERLFRHDLATMQPYVPIHPFEVVSQRLGRAPEQIVKLDANENPYGPSPRAVAAMAGYPWLHIYPDPQSTELRAALADYTGVPAERILAGHGADELIDLLGRLALSPGDAVIDCPPTFGMYAFCAAVNGACLINVPRRADFSLDVDAIERIAAPEPASGYDDFGWLETVTVDCGEGSRYAADGYSTNEAGSRYAADGYSTNEAGSRYGKDAYSTNEPFDHTTERPHDRTTARPNDPATARYGYPRPKLLFLCSPNNPDGGLLPAADLVRLLRLPLLVVVDEAYIEFARPDASYIDWVAEHPNLVVLRTFSKWAGLGGLRVGYGVFPPAIIEQLWKIKQPYNVNVAGSRAAIASLADRDTLLGNVAKLVAERERLHAELARFDFLQPVPGSQSNFILCRVAGRDARQLKLDLEQQGVLVRHFAKPGVDNCIRISVGRPADSEALLAALITVMIGAS